MKLVNPSSRVLLPNYDGTRDSRYPLGNKPQTFTLNGVAAAVRSVTAGIMSSAGGTSDGRLPAGYYVPAKMPLTQARVVYPRPDSETSSRAFHRNALPNQLYTVPIITQGGSQPKIYRIISAPPGTTLGQFFWQPDYGTLKVTAPSSGTMSFNIQVEDQDGSLVNVVWTAAVGTGWVIEINPTAGNDANNGVFGSPIRTWTRAAALSTTGRFYCLREGLHQPGPDSISGFSVTNGAGGLYEYPGETAVVDFSNLGSGRGSPCFWVNSPDVSMVGGSYQNIPPGAQNPQYLRDGGVNHRGLQWKCRFMNGGNTSTGFNDNEGCLWLMSGGAQRLYWAQWECHFDNLGLPSVTNGFFCIDTYNTRYVVVGRSTFGTSDTPPPARSIWIKGAGSQDITIEEINNPSGNFTARDGFIDLYIGYDGSSGAGQPGNIEVRHCKVRTVPVFNSRTWGGTSVFIGGSDQPGDRGNVWMYRNTIVGPVGVSPWAWSGGTAPGGYGRLPFYSENDVIINGITESGGYRIGVTNLAGGSNTWLPLTARQGWVGSVTGFECHGGTSGIVDENLNLTGSYAVWRGQRGAEYYDPNL